MKGLTSEQIRTLMDIAKRIPYQQPNDFYQEVVKLGIKPSWQLYTDIYELVLLEQGEL